MSSRGLVTLQRPSPLPPRLATAGPNTTMVGSNLYALERETSFNLYSYFVQFEDRKVGWREKLKIISSEIFSDRPYSWLLDKSGGVIYSLNPIAVGVYDRERLRISEGPRVASEVLSMESICRMVFNRLNTHTARSTEVEIECASSNWLKVQLSGISALTISPIPGYERIGEKKALLDVFLSLDSDPAKMNHWIAIQKGAAVKVVCDHYDGEKQIGYSIVELSDVSAFQKVFEIDGKSLSVADYFAQALPGYKQWIVKLRFPYAPLALDRKGRYLPLELCRLLDRRVKKLRSHITANETRSVSELLEDHVLVKILLEFGVSLKLDKSLQTRGRLLPPSPMRVLPPVNRESACAILSFVPEEAASKPIAAVLRACGEKLNLNFAHDKVHKMRISHLSHLWEKEFRKCLSKLPFLPEIYFVISDAKIGQETHDRLKVVFDLKLRVCSQFLTVENFKAQSNNPDYWESLLQQIALKIGPAIPSTKPPGTVVGSVQVQAAVGSKIKALALSLSYDNSMSVYTSQARLALQGKEFDFGDIIYNSFIDWFQKCKSFPVRLIMYLQHPEDTRVFSNVAEILRGAQAASSRINRELRTGINVKLGTGPPICPNWTFILCSKKSGVLLNAPDQDVSISSNLVATHGIEFFIKPSNCYRATKYSVIHDTNSFSAAELETFTHQISNSGSGFPVPVGHASKVVKRMNLYIASEMSALKSMGDESKIQLLSQKLFDPELALFNTHRANYL